MLVPDGAGLFCIFPTNVKVAMEMAMTLWPRPLWADGVFGTLPLAALFHCVTLAYAADPGAVNARAIALIARPSPFRAPRTGPRSFNTQGSKGFLFANPLVQSAEEQLWPMAVIAAIVFFAVALMQPFGLFGRDQENGKLLGLLQPVI